MQPCWQAQQVFACHATFPPDQHCNSTGVLTSAASAISPISGAAHHVVFSVWLFFATFGDAVSQVGPCLIRPLLAVIKLRRHKVPMNSFIERRSPPSRGPTLCRSSSCLQKNWLLPPAGVADVFTCVHWLPAGCLAVRSADGCHWHRHRARQLLRFRSAPSALPAAAPVCRKCAGHDIRTRLCADLVHVRQASLSRRSLSSSPRVQQSLRSWLPSRRSWLQQLRCTPPPWRPRACCSLDAIWAFWSAAMP